MLAGPDRYRTSRRMACSRCECTRNETVPEAKGARRRGAGGLARHPASVTRGNHATSRTSAPRTGPDRPRTAAG
jgi:hypothetical protein